MRFIYKGRNQNLELVQGEIEANSKREAILNLKKEKNVAVILSLKQKREFPLVNNMKKKLAAYSEARAKKKAKKESKSILSRFNFWLSRDEVESSGVLKKLLDRLDDYEIVTDAPESKPGETVNLNIFIRDPGEILTNASPVVVQEEGNSTIVNTIDEQKPKVQFGRKETVRKDRNDIKLDFSKFKLPAKQGIKIKVPEKEIRMFTKKLSILLSAGLSISKALVILQDTKNKAMQKIIKKIREDVQQGNALSYALSKFPNQFNQLYVAMVAIGETSGSLEQCLLDIVDFQTRQAKIKSKLKAAMIYPLIIFSVIIILFLAGSIFFIPMFRKLFEDLGMELPLLTKIIFAVADKMYLVILIPAALIGLVLLLKQKFEPIERKYKLIKDKLALTLPVIKKMTVTKSMFYFYNTLALMLKNGIRLLDALKMAEDTVSNWYLRAEIQSAQEYVIKGASLSDALKQLPHFEAMATSIVLTGEESGRINYAMKEVSDYYNEQMEVLTEQLIKYAEPMSILLIALIVIPVLLGIFLPLLDVSSGAYIQ